MLMFKLFILSANEAYSRFKWLFERKNGKLPHPAQLEFHSSREKTVWNLKIFIFSLGMSTVFEKIYYHNREAEAINFKKEEFYII